MAEPSKCFMAGLGAVYTPPKRPFSGSNVSTTSQGGLGVGSMALPGIIERYIPPTGPFPLDSLFSNDATRPGGGGALVEAGRSRTGLCRLWLAMADMAHYTVCA